MPLVPITKMLQRLKLEIWKSIHRLPLGLIRLWQLYSLQRLIRHAYANTALYRDLWDKQGIQPSQLKRLSDLQRFPVISKKVFLNAPIESYIGLVKSQFYTWRSTSGTSGEPFTFLSVRNSLSPYNNFLAYRFLYWKNFSQKIIQNELPTISINVIDERWQYKYGSGIPFDDILLNTGEALNEIFQKQPTLLVAFPSVLIEFVQKVIEFPRIKKNGVKYVCSYGENLTQSQRELITSVLNCEVFDRYGLEEFGVIGTECQYHNGFHINVETFVLEIVDDSGLPVSFGEKGRIVVTDLRNYAMPFIRYDTGDLGYFLKGKCSCGLDGKRLIVAGRIGQFITVGPKKIHYLEFEKIMRDFSMMILQYQVVKIDEYAITLFIVRGPAMTEFILEHIREKVQALIGKDCHLNIESVTKIKRTPRGKCQTVINL